MNKIVGRIYEREILQEAYKSDKSELIALYGRRRVGKTYLIREFFKNQLVFEYTGLYQGSMSDQLKSFNKAISKNSGKKNKEYPSSWLEGFTKLEKYLNTLKSKKKKVIFIDEFPWIATAKSKFLMAFENFWNTYCTKRKDIIVVICGSAASYMVRKIIRNKGGLHNRITRKIRLLPFNLHETEKYLITQGMRYTRYDLIQLYSVVGGVPHYLQKLAKALSVSQNVDQLCFSKDGVLKNEFNELFASLFDNSDRHKKIIKTLSKSNKGITRNDLIKQMKVTSSGDLTLKLEELIESGFVTEYSYFQNKKQLSLYRLTDEYSRFYMKFLDGRSQSGTGTWQKLSTSHSYKSWSGFAFETICLKHVQQIKQALRIDAIYSTHSSWFNANAQIDLLIDRSDNVMNICELKFHNGPFSIDKRTHSDLLNKIYELRASTKTRKNIFITLITTFGINENQYSRAILNNALSIDSLFSS